MRDLSRRTLLDFLRHWVEVQPDKTFAEFLDLRGEVLESCTYASFERRTRSLAASLAGEVGLVHGDRAVLAFSPGLDLVAAFMACARIGVIPAVAAPPRSREARNRVSGMLRDSGAKAVLTDGRTRGLIAEPAVALPPGCCVVEFGALSRNALPAVPDAPHDILFLQYTSGSTGAPRGVMVSHENIVENCWVSEYDEPVGVSWLPQFHDMGMIGYYLFLIVTGGTTFGFSPSDFLRRPVLWFETLSRHAGTITSAPNFAFEYCLDETRLAEGDLAGVDLSSVRAFMNGSEPVAADTMRRFLGRFGRYGLRRSALATGYGLAENTLAVSVGWGGKSFRLQKRALERGAAVPAPEGWRGRCIELASCGRPLCGVQVRIVDESAQRVAPEGMIGEIWLSGTSRCPGYWGQPELSERAFGNRLPGDSDGPADWLRTGDLGFQKNGELCVCGRIKDVIILRGRNFHASDVEAAVEAAGANIRAGQVAAFQERGQSGALVVAVGVTGSNRLPDLAAIVQALRRSGFDGPVRAVAVPQHAITRTTSGKRARSQIREDWTARRMTVLDQLFDLGADPGALSTAAPLADRYRSVLNAFGLTGDETRTLGELGFDSLALVELVMALEGAAERAGAADVKAVLGGPLLQDMRVTDLSDLVRTLSRTGGTSVPDVERALCDLDRTRLSRESAAMREDSRLDLTVTAAAPGPAQLGTVLMTGGTGFLGPFLLASLLENSDARIRVLVRAADSAAAQARLRDSLLGRGLLNPTMAQQFDARVVAICGDLSQPALGLSAEGWTRLAAETDSVIHNAACVDYVRNYRDMKAVNVDGTRELIRLTLSGMRKRLHHVSSTIVFGWAAQDHLSENDANPQGAHLDFGYAQTKWVSERLVVAARDAGLDARIYRPSFVTASLGGIGDQSDIVVRILAFMINNGLAPWTRNQLSFLPVDIAAHNMARLIACPDLDSGTYHVTVDDYYNLVDVTEAISRDHGVQFRYVEMEAFVCEMRRLCTEDDIAFPLLDFITRTRRKFLSMQHKRYSNANYRSALRQAGQERPDPTLSETVSALVAYMRREGLVSL